VTGVLPVVLTTISDGELMVVIGPANVTTGGAGGAGVEYTVSPTCIGVDIALANVMV